MKQDKDMLPMGHPDPMLMSERQRDFAISELHTQGEVVASAFLSGIQFALISLAAAGVNIPTCADAAVDQVVMLMAA